MNATLNYIISPLMKFMRANHEEPCDFKLRQLKVYRARRIAESNLVRMIVLSAELSTKFSRGNSHPSPLMFSFP